MVQEGCHFDDVEDIKAEHVAAAEEEIQKYAIVSVYAVSSCYR